MRRLPLLALLGLTLAAAVFVFATADRLPSHIATHFGASGMPNGWMSRSGYAAFMLCFTVVFPLLVAGMAGGLPRLLPELTNIPGRAYWMAPDRREATLDFLASHACWLGCLIAVFAAAMHWVIIQAHTHTPVRLGTAAFLTVLGLFLSALALWIAVLLVRFRQPG